MEVSQLTKKLTGQIMAGILLCVIGATIGNLVWNQTSNSPLLPNGLTFIIGGSLIGLALTKPAILLFRTSLIIPTSTLLLGIVGLLIGLSVAALLAQTLGQIPGNFGTFAPVASSILFGILGLGLFIAREGELFGTGTIVRRAINSRLSKKTQILVDTSAIIDGRILDVAGTGFLTTKLSVPQFILDELWHIADSNDSIRRNRGRRGLDILNQLMIDPNTSVNILAAEPYDGTDADVRLIEFAKKLRASIFTTDYNLNRVAEIHGIQVLNVNELANALRPVVLPGEEMSIKVVQEGRESAQGVGFLDDGTMVVVENGRRFINQTVDVSVTRILQTAAGRIVFTQARNNP